MQKARVYIGCLMILVLAITGCQSNVEQNTSKVIKGCYVEEVLSIRLNPNLDKKGFKVVYTPQHGTSYIPAMKIFEKAGYKDNILFSLNKQPISKNQHNTSFLPSKLPHLWRSLGSTSAAVDCASG